MPQPVALTIAGSDSGGGAGLQADLKTFHRFGVFGATAITAITAQNTRGVMRADGLAPDLVAAQLDAVLQDIGAAAAKTGMLFDAAIVEAVVDRLLAHGAPPLVVDPVMVAKGGARLLQPEAERALVERLLPLAALATPNAEEAAAIAGRPVRTLDDLRDAARAIADLGPAAVLVKGGHADASPDEVIDVLYADGRFVELRAKRLASAPNHGGGCTLSAAITAALALGDPLPEAVRRGHRFLQRALAAGGVPGRGRGHGCPDHRADPS